MSEAAEPWTYSNLSGRPRGPFIRAASLVLSGVRTVQAQTRPYALAWQRVNLAALAASGPLWVALGDSMTQGIGASAYDNGWVGQLSRVLTRGGQHYRVVNLSFSGARTADVLDRQLPALRQLGPPPDLVTLLIGSNDMLRRKYRDALPVTAAALLAALPAGTVLASLPNPRPPADEVNGLIRRAADDGRLIVADLRASGPVSWRGRLAADHFHPNDLGYTGLAASFAETIAGQPALGCPAISGSPQPRLRDTRPAG